MTQKQKKFVFLDSGVALFLFLLMLLLGTSYGIGLLFSPTSDAVGFFTDCDYSITLGAFIGRGLPCRSYALT